MDNLIYIWIINRLLNFFANITPICIGSGVLSVLIYFIIFCARQAGDLGKESADQCMRCCKRCLIGAVILGFFCGLFGTFTLNKTEFKTVAVYLIGKEIVQSDRGEKIITIIDTKLDEWIKKIEK